MALYALPSENLPKKSLEIPNKIERRHLNIVNNIAPSSIKKRSSYSGLKDLVKKNNKLKLNGFVFSDTKDDLVKLTKSVDNYNVPLVEICFDETLEYNLTTLGWRLPDNHSIYKNFLRSLRHHTLSELLTYVTSYELCPGLNYDAALVPHVVPTVQTSEDSPFSYKTFYRPSDCEVLISSSGCCETCKNYEKKIEKSIQAKERKTNAPLHPNAPLKFTSKEKICNGLLTERKEKKELVKKVTKLEEEIQRMRREIVEKKVVVDEGFSQDILNCMEKSEQKVTPFMKMFWEQQTAAFNVKKVKQYHPMIIRFCLSLIAKSPAAYEELRDSNILVLPSKRTLLDYKNAIRPKVGFNPEVIEELKKTTENLTGHQRYVTLAFDEMKIKENLVFDQHHDQLIGFVDLGDPDINFGTFSDVDELASYVLMYYVRGISSDLKFCVGHFATNGMSSEQIMSTFWEAVGILEIGCNLKVVAAVSDGASSNRKFYSLHNLLTGGDNSVPVHRTVNLFDSDRFIYFFSDAPHLIKTVRNSIFNSGFEKVRLLMNNGKRILWSHLVNLVNDQVNSALKMAPKLTHNHINLTPYSKMNVNLASQVLSKTVAVILKNYYPEDTHETATLCDLMNTFFDCLNSRCQNEGLFKRNENLRPYYSADDERFNWLKDVFLKYFDSWYETIQSVDGLSDDEKNKLFIPHQTYNGLKITTLSLIEVTKFLLSKGMPFVMSSRFNQDCLEELFGRHRSLGRRNDNPSLHQIGYQSNTLRLQRSVVPATGNTKGAYRQKRQFSWETVDDTPLKKRAHR